MVLWHWFRSRQNKPIIQPGGRPTRRAAAKSRLQVESLEDRITPTIFTNSNLINIIDNSTAQPFPSIINVAGLVGTITNVDVILHGVDHFDPGEIDVLLVAPGGQTLVLVSDAGNEPNQNVTVVFDDSASGLVPQNGSWAGPGTITYQPTDYPTGDDSFPSPAPPGPYNTPAPSGSQTLSSAFGGLNANGNWALFVLDDTSGNNGRIAQGWSLDITTTGIEDTTTTVQSSQNPQFTDQLVTFVITVTRTANGTPVNSGVVTLMEGSAVLQGATNVGANGQVTFTALPNFFTAGDHIITATYSDNGSPPVFGSSIAEFTQTMLAPGVNADLAVALAGPIRRPVRTNIIYMLSVSNLGPDVAANVVLRDVLPASVVFRSQAQISGPAFNLANSGNDVMNTLAVLPAGATATFQIVAFAPRPATVLNMATVQSATNDPKPIDNAAAVQTLVGNRHQRWIAQIYRDLLHREVRGGELAIAEQFLRRPGVPRLLRFQVAHELLKSLEYKAHVIDGAYDSLLAEPPTTLACKQYLDFLLAGATFEQLRARILGTDEYFQDQGGANAAWAAALYQDVLGRSITAAEENAVLTKLAAGTTREKVALALLNSTEARIRYTRRLYNRLLNREPTANELRNVLNQFRQGVRREVIIATLVASPEYFAKV